MTNNSTVSLLSSTNAPNHNDVMQNPLSTDTKVDRVSLLISLQKLRRSKYMVLFVVGLALFTDMVVYGVIVPVISIILVNVNQEPDTGQGLLFAALAIGLLLSTPIFGILSDKYHNRKIPMIISQAGLAAATLFFAFASSFTELIIARVLQGVAAAGSWVVGCALLADTFPTERLSFAIGIVLSCNTLGFFLGPIIGGLFYEYFGIQVPFFICTGLALFDLIVRLFVKPPPPVSSSSSKGLSILKLIQNVEISLSALVITVVYSSYSTLESIISLFLKEFFDLNPLNISLVMISFIIPSIFISLLLGTKFFAGFTGYKVIFVGLILHAAAPPLLYLAKDNLIFFIFSGIYFGASSSIAMTPIMPHMSLILDRIGETNSYGRVFAIVNCCYSIAMIVGPIASEALLKVGGNGHNYLIVFLVFSALHLLYAPIFGYFNWRKHKTLKGGIAITEDDRVESLQTCNDPITCTYPNGPVLRSNFICEEAPSLNK